MGDRRCARACSRSLVVVDVDDKRCFAKRACGADLADDRCVLAAIPSAIAGKFEVCRDEHAVVELDTNYVVGSKKDMRSLKFDNSWNLNKIAGIADQKHGRLASGIT